MKKSLLTRPKTRAKWSGRRYAGAAAATLAGAGLATVLTVGGASAAPAATAPGPAPGIAPASVSVGVSPSVTVLAYTAADGSVWLKNLSTGGYISAGGRVTAAPAVMDLGSTSTFVIFGRGTDNQLWTASCTLAGGCGAWSSLGGTITSKPGAVFQGPSLQDWSVYARGTNGALWARSHTASGWGAWHSFGGNLLAGTGPSAAQWTGTYVLVVGTNRQLYSTEAGVTGFVAAGGSTAVSPALILIGQPGPSVALVGFARGTDNAAYYHRFLSTSPGWHSMGGVLTTGLAASSENIPAAPGANDMTNTFGLGSDNHVYQSTGTWGGYPPVFTAWQLAG